MDTNNNILISLPSFTDNKSSSNKKLGNSQAINLKVIELTKKYPEKFYDGIKIDSVYDSFPCIWGGGRAMEPRIDIPKDEIEKSLKPFLDLGVEIRYNFTNCLLKSKHLNNVNCHKIIRDTLQIMKPYNTNLRIVVNSSLLKEYLETIYPQLNFIYSTTLDAIGIEEINKRTVKDMLVLGYNYNNDFDFLNKLAYPENIEVLANENCVPYCPYRKFHFNIYSAVQLGRLINKQDKQIEIDCPNRKPQLATHIKEKQVQTEDFINSYIPLGINKLKIVGRGALKERRIFNYCNWLVKPEYREEIKNILMSVE